MPAEQPQSFKNRHCQFSATAVSLKKMAMAFFLIQTITYSLYIQTKQVMLISTMVGGEVKEDGLMANTMVEIYFGHFVFVIM